MTTHAAAAPGGYVPPADLTSVYVWEWPVRVTHWVIAISIVMLSATGIYIGNPFIIASGEAGSRFVMGTMKVIHAYAAIAFTLAVLSRVLWMFIGNPYSRWNAFLPVKPGRIKGLIPTLRYYLFFEALPPGFVGHNPLAGLAYLAVFGLYAVMIVTGLGIYGASADVGSPMRAFTSLVPIVGGLQMARWFHHIVMWLLLGFSVHHIYSAILMTIEERNGLMDSIVSGYKVISRSELIATRDGLIDRRELDV
jgi:Ni/Fe-hydrogenase 1 B-type cytochrome subunit